MNKNAKLSHENIQSNSRNFIFASDVVEDNYTAVKQPNLSRKKIWFWLYRYLGLNLGFKYPTLQNLILKNYLTG